MPQVTNRTQISQLLKCAEGTSVQIQPGATANIDEKYLFQVNPTIFRVAPVPVKETAAEPIAEVKAVEPVQVPVNSTPVVENKLAADIKPQSTDKPVKSGYKANKQK